jgi:hypothetical protein
LLLIGAVFQMIPLSLPRGLVVETVPQVSNERSVKNFDRLALIKMNHHGRVAVVVAGRIPVSSSAQIAPESIYIFQGAKLITILPRPNDMELASVAGLHIAEVDAQGHKMYPQVAISDINISENNDVYVTMDQPFDGAYSGVLRSTVVYKQHQWMNAIPDFAFDRQINASIINIGDVGNFALLYDYTAATDYVGSDAQDGLTEYSEVYAVRGHVLTALGHGAINDIRGPRYVGYLSTHLLSEHRQLTALEWTPYYSNELGPGIAWSVNSHNVIVGDDRVNASVTGYPTAWIHHHKIRLSDRRGTAFSVNDSGAIVGDVAPNIAFFAHLSQKGPLIENLDQQQIHLLHGWHIKHACSIADDGEILAMATDPSGEDRVVELEPVR